LRWGKQPVGLQPAATTRPPPRTDRPPRRCRTRPSSYEPPINYLVGNREPMPERKRLSRRLQDSFAMKARPNRSLKQFEIDRLAHGSIAGVVWMQVVAAVIGCGHGRWTGRIGNNAIEVDESIKGAAGPDPVVDGQALRLLVRREISLVGPPGQSVFERQKRAADDLDRAQARALD